jgi:hypothetical protein
MTAKRYNIPREIGFARDWKGARSEREHCLGDLLCSEPFRVEVSNRNG